MGSAPAQGNVAMNLQMMNQQTPQFKVKFPDPTKFPDPMSPHATSVGASYLQTPSELNIERKHKRPRSRHVLSTGRSHRTLSR